MKVRDHFYIFIIEKRSEICYFDSRFWVKAIFVTPKKGKL